jgi:hypothetical protein
LLLLHQDERVIESVTYQAAGFAKCVQTSATLQDIASVDDFLNVAATETVPLFDYLEFEFLLEYDVFAPSKRGRTRVHQPPDLFRGFLPCDYEDVYGTRPVTRELQHSLVWYYYGLDKPPFRDTASLFILI